MKVSLLVPVYGVQNFIERCVISLFEQTYKNIEYIFVDDCCKDSSITILEEVLQNYPDRIFQVTIIRHKTNQGLAQARNTALENASGDYVLNVDSDDYLEKTAVEILCNKVKETGADVVVFGSKTVYKNKTIFHPNHYAYINKCTYLKAMLEKKITSSVWTKFVSRALYIDTNIRAIPGLNQGEDYAVMPRLLYYAQHIVMIEDCLYNYIQYNDSAYTKNFKKAHIEDLLLADEILINFFTSLPDKNEYVKSLLIARARTKTYMFKIANTLDDMKEISKVYTDLPYDRMDGLSIADRLLLFLTNHGLFRLSIALKNIGFILNRIFRKL